MKTKSLKKILPIAIVVFAMSLSSCNRGTGCPTNFSLGQTIAKITMSIFH